MNSLLDGIVTDSLIHIMVVLDAELLLEVLGSDERHYNDIGVDTAQEDAHDFAILIASSLTFWREREALAKGSLNGSRGRRCKIAKLIRGSDDESAETSRREFHQVDWDDSPSALHAELLEERRRSDLLRLHERIRIQQCATENADDDDAEAPAEYLRRVADNGAASNSAKVRNHLRDGDLIGIKVQLVLEHGRIQILAAVRHEVEASHEADEVGEEKPVSLKRDFPFAKECAGNVLPSFAHSFSFAEDASFRKE